MSESRRGPPSRGSLQDERKEILRLISRLRQKQRFDDVNLRANLASTLGAVLDTPSVRPRNLNPSGLLFAQNERLQRHQQELAGLRQLRTGLQTRATSAQGAGILAILQSMEQRLAQIEERLQSGVPQQKAGPAQLPRPEANYTLSGVIQGELLSDILQLVSSNSLTGIFIVMGEEGKFTLYFQEGQIVHATGPDNLGEPAFYGAFAVMEGRYTFEETDSFSEERTITGNTQFLILEALRQIDESRAGQEG